MISAFRCHQDADAIVWRGRPYDYGWLLREMAAWRERLDREAIAPGTIVALEADFSPAAVAAFLTLMESGCVIVPLTSAVKTTKEDFLQIAEVEVVVSLDDADAVVFTRRTSHATHELYAELRARQHPGLVLFSSGSTGISKAAVHDLVAILDKFRTPRQARRAIAFLMFDHIGGINTMLYMLSNAGCMVTVPQRSPDAVLKAIEQNRVELLPTSPTFLNLILLSEAYHRYDLSSLKMVTYGTEPMPPGTLQRFHQLFPAIELRQTYGLTEVGILRSKSKTSDSLWVKLGGEGFQIRIVENILHIKSPSAMLGYLNAPSPFTADGWFITGDVVEQDGEYYRILGRQSEIINVGGEKVYPAEVENVIEELDNIVEAVVYGERNPITGNMVCARVALENAEDPKTLTRRVKEHCAKRLQRFKIPVKVVVVSAPEYTERFKKRRLACDHRTGDGSTHFEPLKTISPERTKP